MANYLKIVYDTIPESDLERYFDSFAMGHGLDDGYVRILFYSEMDNRERRKYNISDGAIFQCLDDEHVYLSREKLLFDFREMLSDYVKNRPEYSSRKIELLDIAEKIIK